MKSRTYYSGLIAILFLSTVAFSTVLDTGDCYSYGSASSDWYWSYASADADAQQTYEDGGASGSVYKYTTTGGYCQWHLSAYAYAYAYLYLYEGEWAAATGVGYASASGPYGGKSGYMSASLEVTGERNGQEEEDGGGEPDGDSLGGQGNFAPYQGLYGSHDAFAAAEIEEGSSCSASATGWGDVGLSLHD